MDINKTCNKITNPNNIQETIADIFNVKISTVCNRNDIDMLSHNNLQTSDFLYIDVCQNVLALLVITALHCRGNQNLPKMAAGVT